MKNKGFTLVELIVSITIVLLLFVIVVPAGVKLSDNAKIEECKNIKKEILSATDLYVLDHMVNGKYAYETATGIPNITLSDLYNSNLIEQNYKIDVNDTYIYKGSWFYEKNKQQNVEISISRVNSNVDYKDDNLKSKMGYYTYSLVTDICARKILVSTKKESKNIVSTLLDDNEVQNTEPNFTTDSTDSGLFKLTKDIANETKPAYYFRGDNVNNWVQFGTYKESISNYVFPSGFSSMSDELVAKSGDPILWRIVRINNDGSTKLISQYNLNLSNQWNSLNKADYINSDNSPSTIKQTIDNWYDKTIGSDQELDKLVVKTDFCNDRSSNYSGVSNRLNNNDPSIPTLKCERNEDIIQAKAGLITADELTYAGAFWWAKAYNKNVNTTYIDNGSIFWTMSPGSSSSVIRWYTCDYLISTANANNSNNIATRPVITLSADAKIISGSGSKSDPYIVEVDN